MNWLHGALLFYFKAYKSVLAQERTTEIIQYYLRIRLGADA